MILFGVSGRPFALFSVCFTMYMLVLQAVRYAIGIPVLLGAQPVDGTGAPHGAVDIPTAPPATDPAPPVTTPGPAAGPGGARTMQAPVAAAHPAAPSGLAVLAGLAALPFLVVTALAWHEAAPMVLVLAAGLPFLLAQDALRHVAIAEGRPHLAVTADGAWLALQVAGSAVLLAGGGDVSTAGAVGLFAVWVGGGVASFGLLAALLGARPGFDAALAWARDNASLCGRVALEFVVTSGSYYTLCFALAALAGADELGLLRAAQTLFGPASVLVLGGATFGVPESVRIGRDQRETLRFAGRLSLALGGISAACGALVWALLPALGPGILPDTWRAVRDVMPWLTAFGTAIGIAAGATAALRAWGDSRWVLTTRAGAGAASLAVGLTLTPALGARGTLVGLLVAEALLAARSWDRLRRLA
ncbi:MAG: hypothetical protein ACLGI2_12330 [Acidimicrobiia bacterium]